MRVVVRIVAGLVGAAGLLALVVGGVVAAYVGPDDWVRTPTFRVASTGPEVTTAPGLVDRFGPRVRVQARALGPGDLWLGVAHESDLASFWGDRGRTQVTALTRRAEPVTAPVEGPARSVTRPERVDWWVVQADGPEPNLEWDLADGQYGIALLRADGQPDVAADVTLSLRLVGLFRTGLVVAGCGLLAVVGAALTFRLTRRPRTKPEVVA